MKSAQFGMPSQDELAKHRSQLSYKVRKWWNWQTHHLEGVAPKGVGVQIPPSAPILTPYRRSFYGIHLLLGGVRRKYSCCDALLLFSTLDLAQLKGDSCLLLRNNFPSPVVSVFRWK